MSLLASGPSASFLTKPPFHGLSPHPSPQHILCKGMLNARSTPVGPAQFYFAAVQVEIWLLSTACSTHRAFFGSGNQAWPHVPFFPSLRTHNPYPWQLWIGAGTTGQSAVPLCNQPGRQAAVILLGWQRSWTWWIIHTAGVSLAATFKTGHSG